MARKRRSLEARPFKLGELRGPDVLLEIGRWTERRFQQLRSGRRGAIRHDEPEAPEWHERLKAHAKALLKTGTDRRDLVRECREVFPRDATTIRRALKKAGVL